MGQIISHVHVRGVRKQYVFDYNLNHPMHAGLRSMGNIGRGTVLLAGKQTHRKGLLEPFRFHFFQKDIEMKLIFLRKIYRSN